MQKTTKVLWEPPKFADNVEIAHIFQSKVVKVQKEIIKQNK